MFKMKERNDRDFCLGPTHEELFTQTVIDSVRSYKEYPMTLYQIQHKYRDEGRPRFGIIRSREFIMKDAYSFDLTEEGLDKSYQKMYDAYCRIFNRLGLDFTIVDADSGAMGGSGSQEFMVKSPIGEDGIAYCDDCGYAANYEKAECIPQEKPSPEGDLDMEKIHTPNAHTIEELVSFLNAEAYNFAKTIIYKADDKYVAAMVRGDREVNEVKLKNLVGCVDDLELAEPFMVRQITNAEVGFAGPVGLDIPVYVDKEVTMMKHFIVGANETDTHLLTNAPKINIPRIDAPLVISCNNPPDKSSVILDPTLYPNSCVYHVNAIRIRFQATKNIIGPRIFPLIASDAPNAPNIGLTVNQKTGSPIPAKGPIIPTLTP